MTGRIPTEAFDYYVGLGPSRSYQAVAEHFSVSKRAVTKHAAKEDWSSRLAAIESNARERSDHDLTNVIEEMNTRHLKTLKIIQGKALETLRSMPLTSAMHAVRALEGAIRQERLIHGEPTDRTAGTIEEIVKRESSRWIENMEVPTPNEEGPRWPCRSDEEDNDEADDDTCALPTEDQ